MRKLSLLTASLLFGVVVFTLSCDNSQKCGKTPFDPEKQFCFANGSVHDKCGGKVYDPSKKFCLAGEAHSKCGGKEYNPSEKFCAYDEIHSKCGGKGYDPLEKFCSANGEILEKCGDNGYDPEKQFCFANSDVYDKCNGNEYDPEKQLCDSRDSKTYKVAKIGEQIWMAENLNYEAKNSLCYDNKPANCDKYGRLYDLNTAAKACPKGWHLPNGKDWDALIGTDAAIGKKLKSKKSFNGTDAFGFSALPGGYRQNNKFRDASKEGKWWEAGKKGDVQSLKFNSDKVFRAPGSKASNYSIRCVKN
jgi:uncharacterized protein (TIGR02145 family)